MADTPLVIANHRAGVFHPMQIFSHRGGLFREDFFYALPADLGAPPSTGTGSLTLSFDGDGFGSELTSTGTGAFSLRFSGIGAGNQKQAATTVINISDLLEGAEVLGTSNDTAVLQKCLNRVVERTGIASTANILTSHVTVDFEDTYWMSEGTLKFPQNMTTIHHPCQKWPKGMTWRNGGVQADIDDPLPVRPDTGKNRDRCHFVFEQDIQRPTSTQIFTLENIWVKGPHSYAPGVKDYDVDREGQEAFKLLGMQWIRFVDCKIDEVWADAIYTAVNGTYNAVNGRDDDVYPGMIEILGGTFKRIGIMNATINQIRCPDAVVQPGWWRNDPTHVNVPAAMNDAPSLSGTQYGLWWHGNAAHPFKSIDFTRSWIDMEPQLAYGHIQDLLIGADTDKAHFQLLHPLRGGTSNMLSAGDAWGLMRRQRFQHIYRDGDLRFGWGASAAVSYITSAIAAGSNGVTLPTGTIHLNDADQSVSGAVLIRIAGLGWTLVYYTGESGNDLTGCTGGVGTLVTGAAVRGAKINHRAFGGNVTSASNNVTLGASGTLFNGDGILHVDEIEDFVFSRRIRIWTDTVIADLGYNNREITAVGPPVGTRQPGTIGSVIVASSASAGAVIKTGQAVTYAFNQPERAVYTSGDLTAHDIQWTKARGGGSFNCRHLDRVTVTNCTGPYRAVDGVPLVGMNDVIHLTQSGNNFFST